VTISDHHSASESYMKHFENEVSFHPQKVFTVDAHDVNVYRMPFVALLKRFKA